MAVKYVGLETQRTRNNRSSLFLLVSFPFLMLVLSFIGCYAIVGMESEAGQNTFSLANELFKSVAPWISFGVTLWFVIAYYANTAIINSVTGARNLLRSENKRVYNLVENLCIASGCSMPKIQVMDDAGLNAFASGLDEKTYTITLTQGLMDTLDDEELEGVLAHELTHIRNHDVRVLIISIVFVGIFSFMAEMGLRLLLTGGGRSRSKGKNGGVMVVVAVLAVLGYVISILMRFAISRNREYMADAGGAALTKKPWALASALRKIAGHAAVQNVEQESVQQLFIEHQAPRNGASFITKLFSTHPPIGERIAILEHV